MATYLTFHDGKIEVPEELQRKFDLREGARLRVVSSAGQLVLDRETRVHPGSSVDWRLLRGALADVNVDFNAELEADRTRENEQDARLG